MRESTSFCTASFGREIVTRRSSLPRFSTTLAMASIVLKLFERISYLLRAAFRRRFSTSLRRSRLRRGLAGRRQHGWVQRAEYFSKLFARLSGIRRMGAFLSAFRLVFALFRRGFGAVSIQRAHAF